MNVNLQSPPNCGLDDYKLSVFQLVTSPRKKKKALLDVECLFCPDAKDKTKYSVSLSIRYSGAAKKAFSIKVVATGAFHWVGGYDQKEGDSFRAWVNGGTILYGLVRSTVAEITGISDCGKVILPTVLMIDIVKGQIEDSLKSFKSETII